MSLREAAEKSGLSHSYIDSLEKGRHPNTGAPITPSPDSLRSLSKAYNYSYDELMRLAGHMREENKDAVDKLIEYLDLELTDEEIIDRMNFKVDNITLSDEEVKEFIAFVRAKRFMKHSQQASSKGQEL
jgi:transcriptional regulator with XRE-family HTH domain